MRKIMVTGSSAALPLAAAENERLVRRSAVFRFRRLRVILPLVFLLAVPLFPASPQRTKVTLPPDLDAAAARVMKAFEVPGMAVAIVKDGAVAAARGYGVRKLGEPGTVDARTLFGIASNTKVFTATAIGLLVEEGKLAWDGRVIDYLPWFQMYDPFVTRELTVRDLLVHRSGLGLGAGDLLWWPASTYDRREVARRLRFIRPATSFRSAYAYDNVLYLVAGEVIEAVSGRTWEDFVAERILRKVGMDQSNVRHSAAANGGNVAATHAVVDGTVRVIKPFDSDNTNPAGGINSCAEDMAKWMLVRLDRGRLADGTRLYSERTSRELETLVTPMPNPNPPPELAPTRANFNGYALGLHVKDFRGLKVVTHTGGLPGYVSQVWLMPELGLGIAVLTNQEADEAFSALTYELVDFYMGSPKSDWIGAYLKLRDRDGARVSTSLEADRTSRNSASQPSLPLEKYAGTYADALYGDVVITAEGGKLVIRFTRTPSLVGTLEHWQYDTFVARWDDRELRADAFVTFDLDPEGGIDQVKMRPFSPDVDFSFDFQDLLLKPRGK
jgi:CubicO group peptidase (beta-lactamase class C family)